MNTKNLLLMLAAILIVVGLLKPDLSNFINNFTPSNNVVNVVVEKPTNTEILDECQGVIDALKEDSDRKQDGPRLASLYKTLKANILNLLKQQKVW